MKSILCFLFAYVAALPARADLQIGGRSYPFHFDDSTLTAAERAAIEADVTAFWGSRTNAVFEPGIDGLVRGHGLSVLYRQGRPPYARLSWVESYFEWTPLHYGELRLVPDAAAKQLLDFAQQLR